MKTREKRDTIRTLLVIISLCWLSAGQLGAQQRLSLPVAPLSSPGTGPARVHYASRNEPPRAIEFGGQSVTYSAFLSNINHYFNIPGDFTFSETESNTDRLGMQHRLLQQYYKGIPLEGMGYRVHEKNGFVTSANGKAVKAVNLNTQVRLTEAQAFELAVKYVQSRDTVTRQGRKLIVSKGFTFTPESFAVAYQFDVDVSLIERWRISIDARDGQLLNKVSLVNTCQHEDPPPVPFTTGTGLTNYCGVQTIQVEQTDNSYYRLSGQTEHGGSISTYDFRNASIFALLFNFYTVYDFYSLDNVFDSEYERPAASVQWATEQAYEYYFNKHNRNSFDNNGAAIESFVHLDVDLENAFWNGRVLAFGDGSNNNPLVDIDVVGHELTHGVTQYEANLQYYNEPGALNESFSDILGKAIEFHAFGDTATWQLARHFRQGGLRDMSNPNLKGQPDTYLGDLWYTGYDDNGGVHYNSGVQNFWFYLLSEGGSGVNDHLFEYDVKSIGMDAAANIVYRNLTEYLVYYSDYFDSRIGSLLATADLYGRNSSVYQEVEMAWDAVGVIDEPIITSFELYDITATTVKIKGNMLPRGDIVTYHFEYGTTPALGSSSPIYKYIDKIEAILTGLQSDTRYYLKLVATNENGNSFSTTEFTTISLTPLVLIKQTVDVTETTATFHGQVNPNSLTTSYYFEYGQTPTLGLVTPSFQLPDTTEFLNVSVDVADLQPRHTYYYRLVATNDFSSATTELVYFFTSEKPVIISYTPATAGIGAEVTITGHHFNSAPDKNVVSFGATRGQVLSATAAEIIVKVPAGASLGPIKVLDAESGLTDESEREFVPTYEGEFTKGSLQLRVGIDENVSEALVEDMDGDGRPDIVVRSYPGFSVFQNVNQGGDITLESFIRNSYPIEIADKISLADLDGNGLKDIVSASYEGLRICPNLSVPGFVFFGPPVDLAGPFLSELVLQDFDQDGRMDIGGTGSTGNGYGITILKNENPKGFLSPGNFTPKYINVPPYDVMTLAGGDLDNDGLPDLLAGSWSEYFLSIFKNVSGSGTFNLNEKIVSDSIIGRYARFLSVDLNQDGWKELITHSVHGAGHLAVFETDSSENTVTVSQRILAITDLRDSAVKPGDLNGDGKTDLLVGFNNRRFVLLKNNTAAGEELTSASLEKFTEYGIPIPANESGTLTPHMTVNDLNGDGRPEVINTYSYSYGPHDGYAMEIWQNTPNACPDPFLITVTAWGDRATLRLPANTTLDQFEIQYRHLGSYYWSNVSSTTMTINEGEAYEVRARAKCYLDYTNYHYINFSTDCYDVNTISVSSITSTSVQVYGANLDKFEIQYSQAGKNEWTTLPWYTSHVADLLPGTLYDLRLRGRCTPLPEFSYRQFTTTCPSLSLNISALLQNSAVIHWTNTPGTNAIIEYSENNSDWTTIDNTGLISSLTPGATYWVRGRTLCSDSNSPYTSLAFTTPCPKVSVLQVDNISPFSAEINWTDDSATGKYILSYYIDPGGPVTSVETNATSFTLAGLDHGTRYTVSVAAECVGNKAFSSVSFTTLCYVPHNLSVNGITPSSARLSWSDNYSGIPYSVDYSIWNSGVWQTIETVSREILLDDLRPGTEYEVRVHINCPSVTAQFASARFRSKLYEETSFGPNPTSGKMTIFPADVLIGVPFTLLDNTGRQIKEGTLTNYMIDLTEFAPGAYTLIIAGEKPMKIVKQ